MTTASERLLLLNLGNPSRLLSISAEGEDMQTLVADLGVGSTAYQAPELRSRARTAERVGSLHSSHDWWRRTHIAASILGF
jgi:hypothetical protein